VAHSITQRDSDLANLLGSVRRFDPAAMPRTITTSLPMVVSGSAAGQGINFGW
jgi:hypothetical protein